MLSTVIAGKPTLRQAIDIEAHPPISALGINKEIMPARNIPIDKPSCVLGSVKIIKQAPNAAIKNPTPISAFADQWHTGKLFTPGEQQLVSSGLTQQLSASPFDDIFRSHTLNINCDPKAIRTPSKNITEPNIMLRFNLTPKVIKHKKCLLFDYNILRRTKGSCFSAKYIDLAYRECLKKPLIITVTTMHAVCSIVIIYIILHITPSNIFV
jgi:hypothetical protein